MQGCRPFKLIDAMILTAAAALWMARMRPLWNELQQAGMASRTGVRWQSYAGIAGAGLNVALALLVVAYLAIRLIPPRPPRSNLIRQPGMLLLGALVGLVILLFALSPFVPLVAGTNIIISLALGLTWVAACRRYRSRAEPGWIEGLGRSVGVGLVIATAAIDAVYFLAP
jgi:amino acid transporter